MPESLPESLAPVTASRVFPGVAPEQVFAVLLDFAGYPAVFPEVERVRVLLDEGVRARVEFHLRLLVPVRYVLDLRCDAGAGTIDWTLVEGDVIRRNTGRWRVRAEPGDADAPGTRVDYQVALTVAAPLPRFVLRRMIDGLVNLSLPATFRALERAARERRPRAER